MPLISIKKRRDYVVKLGEIVEGSAYLFAHTHEEKTKETLKEHLDKVIEYYKILYKEKHLDIVNQRFQDVLGNSPLFEELLEGALYLHDIGKINLNFQCAKMESKYFIKESREYKDHALLSAYIYIDYYFEKFKQQKYSNAELKKVIPLLILNAYVISRHHSDFSSLKVFEEALVGLLAKIEEDDYLTKQLIRKPKLTEKRIQKFFDITFQVTQKEDWGTADAYIYTRWLYSVLVACDFYATSEYMTDMPISDFGLLVNKDLWFNTYENTSVYKSIQSYQRECPNKDLDQFTPINALRSELFLEAEHNFKKEPDAPIYYLEAPTGSGKTNTSIHIVLELLNKDVALSKVFYIFPFNTLAEQTYKSLTKTFGENVQVSKEITVVNAITPIKNKKGEEEDEIDYSQMLLDRQFFHYPVVITSHIQLFNLLFESSRDQAGGLYQLSNSVIIIDEVQAYKNTLWTEIIGFFRSYAKLLNLRIIIMSATLPHLGNLIGAVDIVPLIQNRERYFGHPLFKNRVKLDFSLLDAEDVLEEMTEKILDYDKVESKILVEFIKKKSAANYYHKMMELQEEGLIHKEIMLITGDDFKWEREKCIEVVKQKKNVLLIATQVIEAGVDIDMDIGFKDISLLDAEEQFLGRINRSCLRSECKAYFFNLDEAATIYKGDYRKQKRFTVLEQASRLILENKNFRPYYEAIIQEVKAYGLSQNSNNLKVFLKEQVGELDSNKIAKRMTLIEEDICPISIFLAREVTIEKDGKCVVINGAEIWEQYVNLIKDKSLPYAQRKVELSNLSEVMTCFIWKVNNRGQSYNERIGDLYYIEDGEKYFTNGKFDREKLSESSYELL